MRLDKYLKVSRIIKRRTLAKEVCDSGRIMVNGRVAKAGTEIKPGDILLIDFGHKEVKVEILALANSASTKDAKELFNIIEEKKKENPQEALNNFVDEL